MRNPLVTAVAWRSSLGFLLAASVLGCGRFGYTVPDVGADDGVDIASATDATDTSDTSQPTDAVDREDVPLVDVRADTAPPAPRILFVRGGTGTVGYMNSGGDQNLGDVFDTTSGSGWGALGNRLIAAGFAVDQRNEGPVTARAPADLSGLAAYRVVVFGSNNATYAAPAIDQVESFVRARGGVLFISDAGFNLTSYQAAPTSDQLFLSRFDMVMNQDHGTLIARTANFVLPTHPILAGVSTFTSNGCSPGSIVDMIADVTPQVVVQWVGTVQQNNGATGTVRAGTASDGSIVVATVGMGRAAVFYDRDTFDNGNLGTNDNARLASNLFTWLAGPN